MIIPLTELFKFYKETDNQNNPNLTEERIYSYCQSIAEGMQKVPVFSGATQNGGVVGYVPNFIEGKLKDVKVVNFTGINYYINKEGCLTIVADGKAGVMFYRKPEDYPIFCMNISCLSLFKRRVEEIQENYPKFDGLDLNWFYLRYKNYLQKVVMGEGVQHFTKTIYETIEIEIPSLKEQKKELEYYSKMSIMKNRINNILHKINVLLNKSFSLDEKYEKVVGTPVEDIFESVSGNSGLTSEYIYNTIDSTPNTKKYKVLSSSTIDRTLMGEIPKERLLNGKEMKVFEGEEGLLVIRNGKAGKLYFLRKGRYTLNDHAYILYLKKDYKSKVNLKWILFQYQNIFFEYSSASDNGTWNKTNFFKEAEIKLIPQTEQEEIVHIYEKIEHKRDLLIRMRNRLKTIMEKEIVSTN